MSKHTPGPWIADTAGWPLCVNAGKVDDDGPNLVAVITDYTWSSSWTAHSYDTETAEANAHRIVECVNAMEPGGKVAALIEAAGWILTWDVAEATDIDPDYQRLRAELTAALAALGVAS